MVNNPYEGMIESVRRVDNFKVKEITPKQQIVYKLKHVPTGLYYEAQGCSVNTSKKGSVYNNKPNRVKWVGFGYNDGVLPEGFSKSYNECELEDWVVEEFVLVPLDNKESKGE